MPWLDMKRVKPSSFLLSFELLTGIDRRSGSCKLLPKDGKPITTWKNKDVAWQNVAQGIARLALGFRQG